MKNVKGFLWDLDGVLSDTSKLHHTAWIQALTKYSDKSHVLSHQEFEGYFNGVPRIVGIKRFLQSRSSAIQFCSDETLTLLSHNIAKEKNLIFRNLISTSDICVFPDAYLLLKLFSQMGYKNGLASQSQNAMHVVEKTELGLYLDSMATGLTALENNIPNKPDPKFYFHASDLLGINISECIVFEDTYAGAFAAVSAGALMCVGVARDIGKATELSSAGCDVIVRDLEQIQKLVVISS